VILKLCSVVLISLICVSDDQVLEDPPVLDMLLGANTPIPDPSIAPLTDADQTETLLIDFNPIYFTDLPGFDPDNLIVPYDQECLMQCANDLTDLPACYSDGSVYSNNCLAVCQSRQNYEDFKCNSLKFSECSTKCADVFSRRKCKQNCDMITESRSIYCFSPGILNVDVCRSKCDDKASEILFNCSDINIFDHACWGKCVAYATAMADSSCSTSSQNFVCGSDGLIYSGDCRAVLAGQKVLSPVSGNKPSDQKLCYYASTKALNSAA
jgi:hypothetical protein